MERQEVVRQTRVIFSLVNLALIFSLALPAAGIANHLLPGYTPGDGRGWLLWLLASLGCLILSLPSIPLIQRRVQQRLEREARVEKQTFNQQEIK
jgi:hypothetical protein